MRKVTSSIRQRRSLGNSVPVGRQFWDYYCSLDCETKREFSLEVMFATGWGKSTFYTRMKDGSGWLSSELSAVQTIYDKYRRIYVCD